MKKSNKYTSRRPKNDISSQIALIITIILGFAFISFIHFNEFKEIESNSIEPSQIISETTPEISIVSVPSDSIAYVPIYETRTFKITAYCACAKCCHKTDGITFSGAHVQEGVTCAADLSVLPLGSIIDIEGIGIRTVQDKGKDVKGDHIDIYLSDHQTALNFGVKYLKVTIIKEGP